MIYSLGSFLPVFSWHYSQVYLTCLIILRLGFYYTHTHTFMQGLFFFVCSGSPSPKPSVREVIRQRCNSNNYSFINPSSVSNTVISVRGPISLIWTSNHHRWNSTLSRVRRPILVFHRFAPSTWRHRRHRPDLTIAIHCQFAAYCRWR